MSNTTIRFAIRDAHGNVKAIHERTEDERGKKVPGSDMRWYGPDGSKGLNGVPVKALPLYGSERVAAWDLEAPIILVEGERKAQTLISHGFYALATATGAKCAPCRESLAVVEGRHVVFWRDLDASGLTHRDNVCADLVGIAASIRTIEWGKEGGDDAHDFFLGGGTEDELDRMLADAPEWQPPGAELYDPPMSVEDWPANPVPPPRILVADLIGEASVSATGGKAYGGKTLSAYARAMCMVAGIPWLDHEVPRPVAVLYVDEELGRPLMELRHNLMLGADDRFSEPGRLRHLYVINRKGVRLDSAKGVAYLRFVIEWVKKRAGDRPVHVIIDTLRRVHGGDENSSEDMSKVFRVLHDLRREYGISFEVIHHAKKNPAEGEEWREAVFRGSGDILAATESVIGFWKRSERVFQMRSDSKLSGETGPRDLVLMTHVLWFKHADEAALQLVADVEMRKLAIKLLAALKKMRDAGGADHPATWNAWRDRVKGGSGAEKAKARDWLAARGCVRDLSAGKRGAPQRWEFVGEIKDDPPGAGPVSEPFPEGGDS